MMGNKLKWVAFKQLAPAHEEERPLRWNYITSFNIQTDDGEPSQAVKRWGHILILGKQNDFDQKQVLFFFH